MSTITTILGADTITASRSTINTNFSNLNSTKKEDNMTTNRILGRNTAWTGAIEEITLGTNLSMTGTTLNASGGWGLTIGTTSITSGTSGRILYDNAGVVGELTNTGTWNNVLDTSPTLVAPILGTPTSGTLTNCTGLPIAGLVSSTSTTLWVGSVELGNASDTTLSRSAAWTLAVEGIRVRTTTPLVVSAASYTTDTGTSLNMDNLDEFIITAQAGALLFNAPGGTLVQGRTLIIRIKDNGTARALTWNAVFRAMGTALPSTTVLSKTLYLGFKYNSTDSKFDLLASAQEA